ncbi:DUF4365 domain-containing protein [Lentzea sp. E54]|uniref:DUF4365 domain-containing protein n=1 Tax=Lentzea xerophila TaxID=3435883 RepID=UPI003DA343B7
MALTELAVVRDMHWVFREPGEEDLGIDAHLEVIDNGNSLGLLLAVQIKSGPSWFRSRADGGWWFRPDHDHVEYWLSHSIPVIVVLADIDTGACYWQHVSPRTLIKDRGARWKLLIPSSQVLNATAVAPLWEVAETGGLPPRDHAGVPIGNSTRLRWRCTARIRAVTRRWNFPSTGSAHMTSGSTTWSEAFWDPSPGPRSLFSWPGQERERPGPYTKPCTGLC